MLHLTGMPAWMITQGDHGGPGPDPDRRIGPFGYRVKDFWGHTQM
jgi:hypothetical protein